MKTDDLISMMAADVAPADRGLVTRRLSQALLLGIAGALLLMLLCFGLRPDLMAMLSVPLFWLKLAFPTALAAGCLLVLRRLLYPGQRVGKRWTALALPQAVIWITTIAALLLAPASERFNMLMGLTWRTCPFNIALLSLPLCFAIVWAVRAAAPTRLRLTGAVAGLLAGATATMVYCLHCPEMGVPFWGVWYCLGMLIPAVAGALLGPRLLRW